jgi:hypothetical protein
MQEPGRLARRYRQPRFAANDLSEQELWQSWLHELTISNHLFAYNHVRAGAARLALIFL